jgi:hypothetical protein
VPKTLKRAKSIARTWVHGERLVGVPQMVNNITREMSLTVANLDKKLKIAVIYHHGVVGVVGVDVMVLRDTELEIERW